MTDSTKPRMTLDLDEIERQIRQTSQNAPATRSADPLAELARIVGQDDPFKSLLAQDRPVQRQQDAEELFQEGANRYPPPPPLRGSYDDARGLEPRIDPSFEQFLAEESQRTVPSPAAFPPPPPPPSHDDRLYEAQDYDDRAFAPAAEYEEDAPALPEEPQQKSRKSLIVVGAVLGVAIVGVAGALTFGGGNLGRTSGEPPIVKADAGPNKVAPQSPGGLEVPNQNKQIYERTQGDANSKIVNREEQPIDVRQAARVVLAPPGQAGVNPNTAASPPPVPGLGEPRRVRTVSVRPDGSIVGDDSAAPAPVPTRVASAPPIPIAAPPAPAPVAPPPVAAAPAPVVSAPATPASTATTPAPAQVMAPAVPPPRPRDARPATTTATTAPRPLETATTASTPEKQQQRLASVAPPPSTPAVTPAPTPAPAATTSSGGFAVQLAVRPSEREARDAFDQFSRRYTELGGMQPIIRRAEVNGSTIYRVRVGPLGRDDAVSLCERLKSSGGQCFVARN
jgi:hypothetical protein